MVAAQPKNADGWLILAHALDAQAKLDEADSALQRAETLAPGLPRIMIARAKVDWRMGRFESCAEVAASLRGDPMFGTDATIYHGSSVRRLGRPQEAFDALRSKATIPGVASEYALACIDLDKPDEAVRALEPFLSRMGEPYGPNNLQMGVRYAVLHTLGEAYEDLGEYEKAFDAYSKANGLYPPMFNEAGFRAGLPLIRDIFSRERMHSAPKPSVRTDRPVFVAAMPRSGTTLLDRLIAAHPSCGGAGETRALRAQVAEWQSPDPAAAWPRVASRLGAADFDRIAKRYLLETDPFGPTALRIADKHLQNWVYVGLIAMAFPDARVIHIHRNLMDTGISCFERLEPGAIPWSTRLDWIGLALRGAEELMQYWKENAPIAFLDVEYENLVRNPEAESRRIISFLGLPWDDACLTPHKRRDGQLAPPPTLGTDQASRPINDKSIGRAARFGSLLDPLREALDRPVMATA
ncbi:MAG: sulfotransferase [Phycisphaerae bacterium]|nr:sulfotransferase [Phycisphaerae bacterium]